MVADSPWRGAEASLRLWSQLGSLAALMALFVVLAPAAAAESVSKCRQMSRQIEHFMDVREMARDRGNASWALGTERHIRHLEQRQRKLCPNYLASIEISRLKRAAEKTKRFYVSAAKLAARYFSFGGFGGF